MEFGCASEVNTIKRLLLKHPSEAFINNEHIDAQWMDLNYLGPPDYNRAVSEFEGFVELLERHVPEIHYLPRHEQTGLDSIYVHDPVIMTSEGAVLCNMWKEQRRGEPVALQEFLAGLGIPILGSITGDGYLEGGDVVLFDKNTLAVAEGYRTNQEGIQQFQNLTKEFLTDFQVVPLPHWQGPDDVLHLMSIISPVDHDLCVVYSRLMSVPFREWLVSRGIKLVEVPDTEFETMGCNVLAISPRRCIMLAGNPRTRQLLENEGVEVMEYEGADISKKGAGGPTCLTRPLWRIE
ncbi:MAG: amidinotransferase [Candidatus Aminicenantes bacterium]|nr:MAG: amidinotransferase [Candidatus Aminicenantes bacterium]